MADNKINVGGRLHSITTGNVLTGANEIFDDDKNKKQSEINTETYVLVNNVNERLSGLSPEQQSALSVAAKVTNNETKLGYYVCDTEGNLAAKVISNATGYILSKGGSIKVKMINANSASDATLNINSTGAKPLYYDGERASTNNSWEANETVEIYYDGTNYQANNIAGGGKFSTGEKIKEVGIDSKPTAGSKNLVKSGGVQNELALGAVYDVSAKNPTAGPNNDGKWESLSALLSDTNLSTLIPISVRKGGMSIKFVQSSDNKYIQARLMADSFTTDVTQWQGVDDVPTAGSENLLKSGGTASMYGTYVENPEFIKVFTDSEDNILWAIKADGTIYFGAGIPPQVVDYINNKIAELSLDEYEDIVAFLNGLEKGENTLQELLNLKANKDNPELTSKISLDKEVGENDEVNETYVQHIENPEFVAVWLDKDERILFGVQADGNFLFGAGVPIQIMDYVANATDKKVDKVDGKSLVDSDVADSMSVIKDDEYISIQTDKDGRIVETIDKKGNKDIEGNVRVKGDLYVLGSVNISEINLSEQGIRKLNKDMVDSGLITGQESSDDTMDVAVGKLKSFGTYKSEVEASPIVPSDSVPSVYNVGYKTTGKRYNKTELGNNIVLFNHDDGSKWDYMAIRKIYNKFGFTSDFCYVFQPFESLNIMKEKIPNTIRLLKDGNGVGLHAIINSSYWYYNRNFDIKPDGSSNFAPTLSEMQGNNVDKTGTNTFGDTITADTLASELWYMTANSTLIPELAKKVIELTDAEADRLNRQFCFYGDEYPHSGIEDLNIPDYKTAESAAVVQKTRLQWLEYYYNRLVDKTIGYSSTATTIASKFAEDYDVPSGANVGDYYPDAAHILNGKMVYYGDTSNAHYSEAMLSTASGFNTDSYQLVGKFKKGLYKDCFSTMNFEVMDRCIAAAEAFFRRYFDGFVNFFECHIHGMQYQSRRYKDASGNTYLDRGLHIGDYGNALLYSSRTGAFCSLFDVLNSFGIQSSKGEQRRYNVRLEGFACGLYYGMSKIRPFKGSIGDARNWSDTYGVTHYLAAFGTSDTGMESMLYDDYMNFVDGIDNFTKFFYENAGKTITRGGKTMRVYTYIKDIIDAIIGSAGTGKIPSISVDTINSSPAIALAVELVQRFCYNNGYEIVNYKKGVSKVATANRYTGGNLFPNPGFKQTKLEYFGGSSAAASAYIPDGWYLTSEDDETQFNVSQETIDGVSKMVFTVNHAKVRTRMYGLPAGDYKLSYKANGDCTILVRRVNSGNVIDSTAGTIIDTFNGSNDWTDHEATVHIDDFYKNPVDGRSYANGAFDGYEDNCIYIEILVNSINVETKLADVKMYKL